MSLTLHSSNGTLDQHLRDAGSDGTVGPAEFQAMRDDADKVFGKLPGMVEYKAVVGLPQSITAFQRLSDELVETMQQIALGARRKKLADAEKAQLKDAIEAQLAYVVLGYKSSVERL